MQEPVGTLEVNVLPTRAALASEVAGAVAARLARVQSSGSVARLVLAGGSVAEEVHRALAVASGSVDWSRVEVWFGDERYVASYSHERNSLAARRDLLSVVGVPDELVHEPPATESGLDVHAAAATWAQDFPAGDFDLVLLGMGPDAHTASLFPERTDVLEPGDTVGVSDSPKPPVLRLSMTAARLCRATEVWFVVAGADKAEAVQRVLDPEDGAIDVVATPAAAPLGRVRTVWWLDRMAAALL